MKMLHFVLVLSLLAASFSFFFFNHNALYVVGGSYVLPQGQVIDGDLQVLFAEVTLEDGARVTGEVFAVGSDLKGKGLVEGGVSSWNILGYTVLIPELSRFQVAH